jgi:hypothetical protein
MSENDEEKAKDKGREKKKSDIDFPVDFSLVSNAGDNDHSKEIWRCPSCGIIFTSYQSYREHSSSEHG